MKVKSPTFFKSFIVLDMMSPLFLSTTEVCRQIAGNYFEYSKQNHFRHGRMKNAEKEGTGPLSTLDRFYILLCFCGE